MRIVLALLTTIVIPVAAAAQALQVSRSPSAAAQAANQHDAQGWTAVRAESWSDAAREFQGAIDSDPRFALAYYALGRAEVGRRHFVKAIGADRKCKELYESRGAEQFTTAMDAAAPERPHSRGPERDQPGDHPDLVR